MIPTLNSHCIERTDMTEIQNEKRMQNFSELLKWFLVSTAGSVTTI